MTIYGCPYCGSTEDFTECGMCDYASSMMSFDAEGGPEYAGDTEYMAVETIRDCYLCESCDKTFGVPVEIYPIDIAREEHEQGCQGTPR